MDDLERCGRSGGRSGRQRGGINKRAGLVHQELDEGCWPANESAGGAERLTKSPHLYVDLLCEAESRYQTSPVRSDDAGRMGFVDHQQGVEILLQFYDRRQISESSIHAED